MTRLMLAIVISSLVVETLSAADNADRIKPYAEDSRYWQYQGQATSFPQFMVSSVRL